MLVIVPVALAAKQSQSFRKVTFPYFVAMCIGIFGAILFWGVRPYFFDVSFNAVSRISTLDQLLDPTTLQRKALYVWWTVVPSLFLGLFSSKGRSLLLLASPFLALSVISNFEEMYKPMNYYSVVPGYLCSLAAIVTIPQVIRTRTGIPVVFLLLSAAISFSQQPAFARPLRTIRRLSKDTVAIPETLNFISDDARVIVGDRDASFVYDKVPIRLWSANQTDHKWDSILIRQNSVAEVESRLSRQTHVCFEDSNWQLLCKK